MMNSWIMRHEGGLHPVCCSPVWMQQQLSSIAVCNSRVSVAAWKIMSTRKLFFRSGH